MFRLPPISHSDGYTLFPIGLAVDCQIVFWFLTFLLDPYFFYCTNFLLCVLVYKLLDAFIYVRFKCHPLSHQPSQVSPRLSTPCLYSSITFRYFRCCFQLACSISPAFDLPTLMVERIAFQYLLSSLRQLPFCLVSLRLTCSDCFLFLLSSVYLSSVLHYYT